MGTTTSQQPLASPRRITVGIAELAATPDPGATLITFALGSCIGVTVYDPLAKVGGLLHFILPSRSPGDERSKRNLCMFADLGLPMLLSRVSQLGAKLDRLVVCAAGGAEILNDAGQFQIGARNRTALCELLSKNALRLAADDTGGNISRTLSLRLQDGLVSVRQQNTERTLWPV